jgi:TetR/AcrR family transcriptional regulator, transcriptional repressor of aconitase
MADGVTAAVPTKQRILAASRHLFAARGFHRTSVRDIADQVGVTDGALYRHFRSKRAVLEALLAGAFEDAFQQMAAVPADVPLAPALLNLTLGTLRFQEEHQAELKVLVLEGWVGDEVLRQQFQTVTARWRVAIADIVRPRAVTAGFDPARAEAVAAQLVDLLWGLFFQRSLGAWTLPVLDAAGRLTPDVRAFARTMMLRFLSGVGADESRA